MNSYEAYKLYIALKSHFTTKSYDYFKHQGKTKATVESYERRKDKIFFTALTKHRDPFKFLAYNFVERDVWIGELTMDQDSISNYRKHKKIIESLTYNFKKELNQFSDVVDMIFTDGSTHPKIVKKYQGDKVSIETLIIVSDIMRIVPYWNHKLKDDEIIKTLSFKIEKFKPFVPYDRDKLTTEFKKIFNSKEGGSETYINTV